MIPFDKRDGFIWINGSFEEWGGAKFMFESWTTLW